MIESTCADSEDRPWFCGKEHSDDVVELTADQDRARLKELLGLAEAPLAAWAWGASRVLDFFETDPAVDAAEVGMYGHTRCGKATLLTVARDERFAPGNVSSSGQGGATLHRRKYGELIENVTSTFYHWMAGNLSVGRPRVGGIHDSLPSVSRSSW